MYFSYYSYAKTIECRGEVHNSCLYADAIEVKVISSSVYVESHSQKDVARKSDYEKRKKYATAV